MDTLLNYRNIKWILFTAIMMTVPSLLFLVMVIMFMPVVFFFAGAIPMVYGVTLLFIIGYLLVINCKNRNHP